MKILILILTLVIYPNFKTHKLINSDDPKRIIGGTLEKISEIDLSQMNIYSSGAFTMDEDYNVAMYDFNLHKILYFNVKIPDKYKFCGDGLGGGPGEFRNPTDITFDPIGRIWITDPVLAKISIWDKNCELIKSFNKDRLIPKAIAVNNLSFLISAKEYSSKDGLFHLYNLNDEKITSFGRLEDELVGSSFFYEGEIHADEDENTFYYAGKNSGFIKKYDSEGTLMYSVKTIDPVPTVKLVTRTMDVGQFKNVRVTKRDEEAITATVDLDTNEKFLFVLFSGTKSGGARYIDLYNKTTGDYIKSYILNFDTLSIKVINEKIYSYCYDHNSKKFKLHIYSLDK